MTNKIIPKEKVNNWANKITSKTTSITTSAMVKAEVTRSCIVCGCGTPSLHEHLCQKCKQAILKMREEMEKDNDR